MKQPQPQEHTPLPHLLTLGERERLTATGVRDVTAFDEHQVIAVTDRGELTVSGENLHISRLSLDSGDLTVEGQVNSLTYAHLRSGKDGFFGKLFR